MLCRLLLSPSIVLKSDCHGQKRSIRWRFSFGIARCACRACQSKRMAGVGGERGVAVRHTSWFRRSSTRAVTDREVFITITNDSTTTLRRERVSYPSTKQGYLSSASHCLGSIQYTVSATSLFCLFTLIVSIWQVKQCVLVLYISKKKNEE
jgi:hypothetical protein